MATVVEEHRSQGPRCLRIAVLTASDTRTEATDTSGRSIVVAVEAAGHRILEQRIVADDTVAIRSWVEASRDRGDVDAVIVTGGTGLSPRDVTVEAIEPLFTKSIPGFGELFRMLSHAEIGSAALMSRACAGLVGRLVVIALPGSMAGVDLAMSRIVLPELPHLVGQAQKG